MRRLVDGGVDLVDDPDEHAAVDAFDEGVSHVDGSSGAHGGRHAVLRRLDGPLGQHLHQVLRGRLRRIGQRSQINASRCDANESINDTIPQPTDQMMMMMMKYQHNTPSITHPSFPSHISAAAVSAVNDCSQGTRGISFEKSIIMVILSAWST